VDKGCIALWWLGQHGFVLKVPQGVLYLDAFLSPLPGRLVPPLLAAGEVVNATLVLGTHDHLDHIDRPAWGAMAAASPAARFVVPDLLLGRLAGELDIPPARFLGVNDGESIVVDDIRIHGIAAAHEMLDRDAATGKFPHLGYVIEANGVRLYHAGDCCIYEGLQTKLIALAPDVMILPINGRDAKRLQADIIGNMTYQEAVDLAGNVGAKLAIPAHWDMFASNPGCPGDFTEYMRTKYPRVATHICRHGERLVVGPFPRG
jgi:L-ascorbate metabolism protein UlaG (beta-lactamase superfamily)